MGIKRLGEHCTCCNRKSLGQDESGFISCVKCDWNSDYLKWKLDNEEKANRSMKIYDALICGEGNDKIAFTIVCTKFKGHKGKHKDSEHPDYGWTDS